MKISQRTLKRLARHVTGDWEMTPYRSGPKLVALFNEFGFDDEYGPGFPSRWMFAEQKLGELNGKPELFAVIEKIFDPLECHDNNLEVEPALEDINPYLQRDGNETISRSRWRLTARRKCVVVQDRELSSSLPQRMHLRRRSS